MVHLLQAFLRPWCWAISHRWRFYLSKVPVRMFGRVSLEKHTSGMICERCGKKEFTR
jgi:hypothetical protein